jgi:hypothetical protein
VRLGVAAALAVLPLAPGAPAPGGDAAPSDSGRPVYATTGSGPDRSLTRRDPVSLAQVGAALALDESASPAGFSPDGALLAFVAWAADVPALRLVDLRELRPAGAVELPRTGTVEVWWTGPRRLLVLAEQPDGLRALVVDAVTARIERTTRLAGTHFGDRRTGGVTRAGTAILLGPDGGSAQVAIVAPAGGVRLVRLGRIRAGGTGRDRRRPTLVVDPAASRALVIGGLDDPVAELDLRTRRVAYHRLHGRAALPGTTAVERNAIWLGAGRLALTGWDGNGETTRRLGLTVVDTRTWRARTLDRDADFLWVASGLLLGQRPDGTVAAFSLGGAPRFTVGEPWLSAVIPVVGNGRYLYLSGLPDGRTLVVDAASGRELDRPYVEGLGELLSPPAAR